MLLDKYQKTSYLHYRKMKFNPKLQKIFSELLKSSNLKNPEYRVHRV